MQNDKANTHTTAHASAVAESSSHRFSCKIFAHVRQRVWVVSTQHTIRTIMESLFILRVWSITCLLLIQLRRSQTGRPYSFQPLGNKFKSLKIFVYSQKWIFIPIKLEKAQKNKNWSNNNGRRWCTRTLCLLCCAQTNEDTERFSYINFFSVNRQQVAQSSAVSAHWLRLRCVQAAVYCCRRCRCRCRRGRRSQRHTLWHMLCKRKIFSMSIFIYLNCVDLANLCRRRNSTIRYKSQLIRC